MPCLSRRHSTPLNLFSMELSVEQSQHNHSRLMLSRGVSSIFSALLGKSTNSLPAYSRWITSSLYWMCVWWIIIKNHNNQSWCDDSEVVLPFRCDSHSGGETKCRIPQNLGTTLKNKKLRSTDLAFSGPLLIIRYQRWTIFVTHP